VVYDPLKRGLGRFLTHNIGLGTYLLVCIKPFEIVNLLGDHEDMTNNLVTLISVVISAISVLVAMGALLNHRHQNSLALGVNILRELEKEYVWSKEMRKRRLVIPLCL
jgi:hypothetical protein